MISSYIVCDLYVDAGLGIASSFDFILTSVEAKAEKPNPKIFEEALKRGKCANPSAAYHVSVDIERDVAGATIAGWNPIRFNEWFDEDFPDWASVNTIETADEGQEKHAAFMKWGRRDESTSLEWVEVWSLVDVLSIFGLPSDPNKLIATTYVKGVLDD